MAGVSIRCVPVRCTAPPDGCSVPHEPPAASWGSQLSQSLGRGGGRGRGGSGYGLGGRGGGS